MTNKESILKAFPQIAKYVEKNFDSHEEFEIVHLSFSDYRIIRIPSGEKIDFVLKGLDHEGKPLFYVLRDNS